MFGPCIICGQPAVGIHVGEREGSAQQDPDRADLQWRTFSPTEAAAYCEAHMPADPAKEQGG